MARKMETGNWAHSRGNNKGILARCRSLFTSTACLRGRVSKNSVCAKPCRPETPKWLRYEWGRGCWLRRSAGTGSGSRGRESSKAQWRKAWVVPLQSLPGGGRFVEHGMLTLDVSTAVTNGSADPCWAVSRSALRRAAMDAISQNFEFRAEPLTHDCGLLG